MSLCYPAIGVTPITATSGADFSLVQFVATLPAGSISIPINVLPIDDSIVELDEILEVFIISSTGNTRTVDAMSTSTVTLLDNDGKHLKHCRFFISVKPINLT